MTCTVEQRASARDVAEQLDAQPEVAGVDVLEPRAGARDEWTLVVTVCGSAVSPQTLLAIGAHGLSVQTPVQSRGDPRSTDVVATLP